MFMRARARFWDQARAEKVTFALIACAAQMNDLSAGQIRNRHSAGYTALACGFEGHFQGTAAPEKPG
jgi:hypothetical protein